MNNQSFITRTVRWTACAFLLCISTASAQTPTPSNSEAVVSGKDVAFSAATPAPSQTLTGRIDPDVILPPAWAFGVLYGSYCDQKTLLENFHALQAADFPVDAIWVDSTFWDATGEGPLGYLDFHGDRKSFPDLRALTGELDRHHVRFGLWIWERIYDANTEVFREFEKKGFFKGEPIIGNGWHNAPKQSVGRYVDFRNSAAAKVWQEKLRPLMDEGVDFFKIDSTPQTDYVHTHFELSQKYGRHTKGRGFVLTHAGRNSAAAIKRYPAAWTGDSQSSWHQPDYPDTVNWIMGGLRQQIEMVSNPTWFQYQYPFLSNDTGGYSKRVETGAAAEELFTRWAQFSAFGSLTHFFGHLRVEGQNWPTSWPESVQTRIRPWLHLRMRLFPYLYTHALRTRLQGEKIIRGDAPHPMQFRFGDAFLVAPVSEPGATTRKVWLPEGERWMDFSTGEISDGGQEITAPAPLERLPLWVRMGSIIPLRDYASSVAAGTNNKLTLDIYPNAPGRSSRFDLLEDDGISNGYLKNEFALTPIICEPGKTGIRVSIGAISGHFDGMPAERAWAFQIHLPEQPGAVTINGQKTESSYSEITRLLTFTWKGATQQPAEIFIAPAAR